MFLLFQTKIEGNVGGDKLDHFDHKVPFGRRTLLIDLRTLNKSMVNFKIL